MDSTVKKKLIKLVHTQKSAAQLDDATYFDLLMINAGAPSTKKFTTVHQFTQVIKALNLVLVSQGKQPFNQTFAYAASLQLAVTARAKKIFGLNAESRLRGLCNSVIKKPFSECSDKDLRRLMGILSSIERTANAKR